ncbi:ABC-type xenobiotic transporter [Ranunculus cassubicifolius]
MELSRISIQSQSFGRSISHSSSRVGDSSRHSFSVSSGLPAGGLTQENVYSDPESNLSKEQTKNTPLLRLAYLNMPEIPVLLLGGIAAIVNGFIYPLFSLLFSFVVKTFFEPENNLRKDIRFWAVIYVVVAVVALVALSASTYFFAVAGCRLIRRIRIMCFKKVVHMEINLFDDPKNSSGFIGARLSADAASVRCLVGDSLALLVQNTASAVFGLAVAFTSNWILSLIVLSLMPLVGLSGYIQMRFTKVCSRIHT